MGNGRTGTAGADQQGLFAFGLASVVAHGLHEAQAVKHVAVPRAVGIAAHGVDGVQKPCAVRGGGAQVKAGELVGHGDDDAVHVFCQRHARQPGGQITWRHMGGHDHGVVSPFLISLGDASGRFDLGDGVADDEVNACGAVKGVLHGDGGFVRFWRKWN